MERVQFFVNQKFQFFESYSKKRVDSLYSKRVKLKSSKSFESYWKKVQFFESDKNKSSTLIEKRFIKEAHWITFKKMGSISMSHVEKRVQFLWVMLNKAFNSVSCVRKRGSILWMKFRKNQFLESFFFWKIFFKRFKSVSLESCYKEGFNSSSHIEKNLWVILKRSSVLCIVFLGKAQFFESFFFFDKNSKIQFFESFFFFLKKKSSVLLVTLKKIQLFELHSKKVQFFESFLLEKSSIFWIFCEKKSH